MNDPRLEKIKEKLKGSVKIAIAESLTSGLIQSYFANISGASNFFEGGITVYNIEQKVKHLNVDRVHAESVDCVSERVAHEMATGVCDFFNSDIGIATTGFAELSRGETPYAYFEIYFKPTNISHKRKIEKNLERNEFRAYVANEVIELFYDLIS